MRRVLAILVAVVGVLPTGCLLPNKSSTPKPPLGTGKIAERPAEQFVGYLNRQASYAQTVRYNDLDLKVSLPGQGFVPTLSRGMLVCSQPNNLRMQAALIAGPNQLDVGANSDEMWMYVKMSQVPYLYCSHQEFSQVQDKLPVKFEPMWVMQALGMATYDPQKEYSIRIDEKGRSYQLIYPDVTAGGQRVLKMTEFAADVMSGTIPQVRRHVVMAEDGKTVIAEARVRKVSEQVVGTDPSSQKPIVLQLPTELVMEWPQEQTKMDLVLGRISVNEKMSNDQLEAMFTKPARIGGVSPISVRDALSSRVR